jgi:thymidylate synthase (FAD)
MKQANIQATLIDHCGTDLSVVNAARVSFAKESTEMIDKDEKLIKYLAEHRHKSPFNHAFMSFRVKAPIFVARQLVKHEYLPWNEVSRRYVRDEPEFYFPDYWRKKADNVKQGSSDEAIHNFDWDADNIWGEPLATYNRMLELGVCAEQARMVLPQNMMTEWIWSGTLYAFAKMCVLRLDSHTQKETREVAEMISKEAATLFPVSWKYLVEHKHAI